MDLFTQKKSQALSLRYYQQDAIDAAYRFLRSSLDNPCVVLPTGAGKTPVIAKLCHDVVKRWDGRVLVLSHVKELIDQTATTIGQWFPDLNVGVYSAGLKRRETRSDVLVAGIQSIYKRGLQVAGAKPFNIVLVDEAHRIPTEGDGMYRQLLSDLKVASPKVRVIGLTATPYRLKGGYVCDKDHFLNDICYEAGVRELIAKGYLCPLVSKQCENSVETSTIGIRSGEFRSEDLSAAFDGDEVVEQACREIAEKTTARKSTIIFCCDVQHAEHVKACLEYFTGQPVGLVTGESADRDKTIKAFKDGKLNYLVNVNVLTEGFDAKQVDCVVLLRSTLSPGLYYQMVGRGLRTHPDKTDCLVLDFGGNVLRHGCVDAIKIKSGTSQGGGEPVGKVCEDCQEVVAAGFARCPNCGHEFPPAEESGPNHEGRADEVPITTDQMKAVRWEVTDVYYAEHIKRGADADAPRTVRVSYVSGVDTICDEWVCVEHGGFAGDKASTWWAERCKVPMPATAAEAADLGNLGVIAKPIAIHTVKVPGERWTTIVKYELGPIPNPDEMEVVEDEWGTQYLRLPKSEEEEEFEGGWVNPKYADYDLDDIPF